MRATIVVDLGFGDAGKGSTVDYLARRGKAAVVRFNGGAQAGHNVITPDGRHHTFAQWGSGTFVGARTHLSRFTLIDPLAMHAEALHLAEVGVHSPWSLLSVDPDCLVVTPMHKYANLLREQLRGRDAHGTCGMGIGECVADWLYAPEHAIRASDLRDPTTLHRKLVQHTTAKLDELVRTYDAPIALKWDNVALTTSVFWKIAQQFRLIADRIAINQFARDGGLIFEGAQGVLLDELHGFHPHTTWSKCTFENALELLIEAKFGGETVRMGVLRAYHTRHGAGPFPTEAASEWATPLADPYNGDHGRQGRFRIGHFDAVLARYALDVVGGVDQLMLTNVDRVLAAPQRPLIATRYMHAGKSIERLALKTKQDEHTATLFDVEPCYESSEHPVEAIEQAIGRRVDLLSTGPTCDGKRERAMIGAT